MKPIKKNGLTPLKKDQPASGTVLSKDDILWLFRLLDIIYPGVWAKQFNDDQKLKITIDVWYDILSRFSKIDCENAVEMLKSGCRGFHKYPPTVLEFA